MEMPWIWEAEAGATEKPSAEEESEWVEEGAIGAEEKMWLRDSGREPRKLIPCRMELYNWMPRIDHRWCTYIGIQSGLWPWLYMRERLCVQSGSVGAVETGRACVRERMLCGRGRWRVRGHGARVRWRLGIAEDSGGALAVGGAPLTLRKGLTQLLGGQYILD